MLAMLGKLTKNNVDEIADGGAGVARDGDEGGDDVLHRVFPVGGAFVGGAVGFEISTTYITFEL